MFCINVLSGFFNQGIPGKFCINVSSGFFNQGIPGKFCINVSSVLSFRV